ncbi:DNA recombination protein RmuC [hydrothermal vent metagenome]|uniref:DNA recombination protein RmuC n=1 Tax=hydrothermal vent metagenome TaxID=652676 RepID=A0A1W1ECS8_9ZZZZ
MNNLLEKISTDSTFMVIGAISIVILIFVLLMVVVSSMRIKNYKYKYVNTKIDNQEKETLISELQNELEAIKIKNAKNEQELQYFAQTKEKLLKTENAFEELNKSTNALELLQKETATKLENTLMSLDKLTKEHDAIKLKLESIQEDNNKMHVNNARLLMKLESESRVASEMEKRTK